MGLKSLIDKVKSSRWTELFLALVFVVTIIFVVSFIVKINTGVSETVERPQMLVRLQVLNATGEAPDKKVMSYIENYRDNDIQIKIVDSDRFDLRKAAQSFIISREQDKTAAELLARKLNLSSLEILYKPLENNYRQVAVTLVIGEDFEQVCLPEEKEKE